METNYDHLVSGGIDALIEWWANSCKYCNVSSENKKQGCVMVGSCESHMRAWLEAEYKEPNSWDKLLENLDKSYGACSYFGTFSPNTCSTCVVKPDKRLNCYDFMLDDIARRIRELRAADNE